MANLISTKRSIGISFATQYVELTIHFLAVLALARILSPDDIGTYSVAAFLMTLLHVFRDFGVVQYVIQERDLTAEKIRSAMGVAIILALMVAAALFFSSGMIARFYDNPAIEKILIIMSASFAISPLGSLLIGILRREMKMQEIFYIKTASAICHVAVALSLAVNGFGAISLAWANFAGILSFGVVANLLRPKDIPWLPRFKNIRTVLSFGGIASLGNAANIAGINLPDLVIGKIMNMAAVGYFSRATGLVQLFTRLITSALLPLVLPYFAQLRREEKDLAAPYLSAVEQLTALAWPFFAGLMLLAYPMVRTLYGSQWDASVPIVELLCLAGAISTISLFAAQVMVANGQVRDSTYSHLLALPFRIGAIFMAAPYGLMGIAIALIVSECIVLVIVSWFLHKTIRVSPLSLVSACRKSAFVTICSSVAPFAVKTFWEGDLSRPWLPLLLGIVGAAIGWIASMLLIRHPLMGHLLPLLQLLTPKNRAKHRQHKHTYSVKSVIKHLAYHCGLLDAYHRFRNRKQLTVVMFHRVLPASDPRYAGADPEWTMAPESFAHCLAFFQKHYHVVSPEQVFSALNGEATLPGRSLLITFDDGWADTAQYAQPVLEKFSMLALIFVAGSAINQESPFWEEHVYSFLATDPNGASKLSGFLQESGIHLAIPVQSEMNEKSIKAIVRQLGEIDQTKREAVTSALTAFENALPAMLDTRQLAQLVASSHTIGGHGMTHQPLTKVADLNKELKAAQETISAYLNKRSVDAMSFPHGAYSGTVVAQCRSAGFQYLFSSSAHLNNVTAKLDVNNPVGRIHISERAILNGVGRFQPAQLATWLFMRPLNKLKQTSELQNG